MRAIPTTKRILLLSCGQSNEVGQGESYDGLSDYPQAAKKGVCADPVPPNGVAKGSMYPTLVDLFADDGVAVTVRTTAVSGAGLIKHWLGDPTGLGNDDPYSMDDAGFDPNGYFASLTDQAVGDFDDIWVLIAFGQQDSSQFVPVTSERYQLACENATNYFLAQGFKVAIGLSVVQATHEEWYLDAGTAGVNAALTTYADNPEVIEGCNLFTEFGQDETTSYLQSDGLHMVVGGYLVAGQLWYDKLNVFEFTGKDD